MRWNADRERRRMTSSNVAVAGESLRERTHTSLYHELPHVIAYLQLLIFTCSSTQIRIIQIKHRHSAPHVSSGSQSLWRNSRRRQLSHKASLSFLPDLIWELRPLRLSVQLAKEKRKESSQVTRGWILQQLYDECHLRSSCKLHQQAQPKKSRNEWETVLEAAEEVDEEYSKALGDDQGTSKRWHKHQRLSSLRAMALAWTLQTSHGTSRHLRLTILLSHTAAGTSVERSVSG